MRTKQQLREKIDKLGLNWNIHRNYKFLCYSIEDNISHNTMQRGNLRELEYFINGLWIGINLKK